MEIKGPEFRGDTWSLYYKNTQLLENLDFYNGAEEVFISENKKVAVYTYRGNETEYTIFHRNKSCVDIVKAENTILEEYPNWDADILIPCDNCVIHVVVNPDCLQFQYLDVNWRLFDINEIQINSVDIEKIGYQPDTHILEIEMIDNSIVKYKVINNLLRKIII